MSDLNIPGVTNTYGTQETISDLMKLERIPLDREEAQLKTYKTQQDAWREVNSQMSSLRDTVRSLYSYDNPFNSKVSTSTDEYAITADPGREANFETFKIDVLQTATADRFLSSEIASNSAVPAGEYVFRVNEKTINLNWKGGKLSDFVASMNRRSANTVRASLIGVTSDTQALLIESLVPGAKNRLVFEGAAEEFALETGMIQKAPLKPDGSFPLTRGALNGTGNLSSKTIDISDTALTLPPRSGFEANVPATVKSKNENIIQFTASVTSTPENDVLPTDPSLPSSGIVQFKDVILANEEVDARLPATSTQIPITPVEDYAAVFIKTTDGRETPLASLKSSGESSSFSINIADYPELESIVVKNNNTHKKITLSPFEVINPSTGGDYVPTQPVETAGDAKIKYQGITMTRPSNEIDDVIPNVTLNVHNITEKSATITIDPDVETAKETLITFVGKYNRLIAELNILSTTKPGDGVFGSVGSNSANIINEIEYFTDKEVEAAHERLGLFQSEFTLTNSKSNLQQIVSNSYPSTDDATITMLSQLGISTGASTGGVSGVTSNRLRGYLEIDEGMLDTALEDNILNIKDIFGYDSNEDMVVDSGLAFLMDRNLQAFIQTGGIIASKNSSLDTRINSSQTKIASLEEKLERTEQNLRSQYGQMESAINSLEGQSSTITNFSNSQNNNN